MKKVRKIILGIIAASLLTTGTVAGAESTYVNEMLESPFLALKLDAEVEIVPEGTPMTIYTTDYPPIDEQSWADMFLPKPADMREAVQIKGKIFSMDQGEISAKYFFDEARLWILYQAGKESFHAWDVAQTNQQAGGMTTTPEQAIEMAQDWIDCLERTLGWNGYVLNGCYTMPTEEEWILSLEKDVDAFSGGYVVEYRKDLDGYPVAYDISPYLDNTKAIIYGDSIQMDVDEDGIWRVTGYCRCYKPKETQSLQISLDEAIAILKENMDYVACYPTEMPCVISEIGLCYRLVQVLPVSDENAAVQTVARPAWRFASRINRFESTVFFMFIDAITGEVLP